MAEVGIITESNVVHLPCCWRVRWMDYEGVEHQRDVMCEQKHIALISVAMGHEVDEWLGEPVRVRL